MNFLAYLRLSSHLFKTYLKLVAVFILSALSFFITDFLIAVGWVLGVGGINIGLSAAIFFFIRAGFAEWVAYTIMGIRGSKLRYRDLALPALIYGTPLWTFNEVFPLNPLSELVFIIYSKWICILPVPQSEIISFIVAPLSFTLILDFPRLILFLAIKKKLSIYNMKKDA